MIELHTMLELNVLTPVQVFVPDSEGLAFSCVCASDVRPAIYDTAVGVTLVKAAVILLLV